MQRRGVVFGLLGAAGTYACGRDRETAIKRDTRAAAPEKKVEPAPSAPAAVNKTPRVARVGERRLGKTGVSVSMLGLGGFHIGEKLSEKESIALIRHAIDGGIDFLDNCWDYNDGKSEIYMGKALADGYRKRVFLMTKLDGRTQKAAAEQLEQSLRRLKTDMIDLVQIHEVIWKNDPKRCFAPGGIIDALTAARKAGKLRFVGFTGHKDPAIHRAMLDAAKQNAFTFDTVQLPLNVMDAHFKSFEHEVLPELVKNDIGVLGMKSMGGGDILASGVVSPEECLRYALSLPTAVVISGMDSMELLEKNLKLARNFRPMNPAEREELLTRTKPAAKDGKHEQFKTSAKYDGTGRNPHWLREARL